MLAGDSGPLRPAPALAGEPAGDGEGPRMPGRWGEVWGEKGGLLWSPWLLETPGVLTPGVLTPGVLTPGLMAASVPTGRSSREPDRSWTHAGRRGRLERRRFFF